MCGILGLGISPECLLIGVVLWIVEIVATLGLIGGGLLFMIRGRVTLGAVLLLLGTALFLTFFVMGFQFTY